MWCSVCEAFMKMSSLQTEVAVDLNVAVEGLSPVRTRLPTSNRDGVSTKPRPLCIAHSRLQTADESQMSLAVLHLHRRFRKGLHTNHGQVFPFAAAAVTTQHYTERCYWSLLCGAAELLYFPEFERNYIVIRNLKTRAVTRQLPTNVSVSTDSSFSVHTFKDFLRRWRMNSIATCRDTSFGNRMPSDTWDEGSDGIPHSHVLFFFHIYDPTPPPPPQPPFIAHHLRNADFKHLNFYIATKRANVLSFPAASQPHPQDVVVFLRADIFWLSPINVNGRRAGGLRLKTKRRRKSTEGT